MVKVIKVLIHKTYYVTEEEFKKYCDKKYIEPAAAKLINQFSSIKLDKDFDNVETEQLQDDLELIASKQIEDVNFTVWEN